MATVDLEKMYEIRAHSTFGGQDILNIYHARRVAGLARAADVAQAFADRVVVALLPLQGVSLTHTLIEVQNLVEATDFTTLVPFPNVGTRVGEEMANFVAMTVQFNRLRTDMKNGQKRFVAGIEADINQNFWLAAFVTSFEPVRDAILAGWFTDGAPGTIQCDYVVIKRICKTTPSPPCVGGYRLPVDDAELVFYEPTSGTVRTTVRSQVSRKRLV